MADGDRVALYEARVEGRRLGRHVNHDPRSRNFPAATASAITSVLHAFHGRPMDQGDLGSCTAHALFDCLKTDPLYKMRRSLSERLCRQVYSRETQIDPYPGSYPPDDTGSDGLSACKVGVERGWLKSYTHTFSFDDCLKALVLQPVMIGVSWWSGMDTPDANGLVHAVGTIRGGHEFALIGIDTAQGEVIAINSWGSSWGINGRFRITFGDLSALLADKGDCSVPVAA